jgi:Icc-related predicted phosphoesterase
MVAAEAAVEAVATKDAAEAVDVVVVAGKELARKRHITRRRNGRNYLTRSEIKSGKSEIERASREEPSEISQK